MGGILQPLRMLAEAVQHSTAQRSFVHACTSGFTTSFRSGRFMGRVDRCRRRTTSRSPTGMARCRGAILSNAASWQIIHHRHSSEDMAVAQHHTTAHVDSRRMTCCSACGEIIERAWASVSAIEYAAADQSTADLRGQGNFGAVAVMMLPAPCNRLSHYMMPLSNSHTCFCPHPQSSFQRVSPRLTVQ